MKEYSFGDLVFSAILAGLVGCMFAFVVGAILDLKQQNISYAACGACDQTNRGKTCGDLICKSSKVWR